MSIVSFVIVTLLAVLGVSALIEFYKKVIRGGKSSKVENWIVGGVLSIGMAALLCFKEIAFLPFTNIYINWAVYSGAIFLLQFFLDMNMIKKIIASALANVDIKKLFGAILPKLGLTPEKIRNILVGLKITKSKFIKELVDNGLSEEVANEIADIIYGEDDTDKELPQSLKATEDPS
jgi:hypothetical protein